MRGRVGRKGRGLCFKGRGGNLQKANSDGYISRIEEHKEERGTPTQKGKLASLKVSLSWQTGKLDNLARLASNKRDQPKGKGSTHIPTGNRIEGQKSLIPDWHVVEGRERKGVYTSYI